MLPLNSWTLIILFHSVQNIILRSDHLHMHQTVIISIMIMRPLPHIRSKEHLGVIRCKASQRQMPYMQRYPLDLSVLHTVAYYCGFSLHPFPSLFSVASRPFPSLFLDESLGKNNVSHRVCWFNLPPVTPRVLILSSPTYTGSEIWEEEQSEWLRLRQRRRKSKREQRKMVATSFKRSHVKRETADRGDASTVLYVKLLDSSHEMLGHFPAVFVASKRPLFEVALQQL